jgi:hypothetical protein
MKDLKRIAKLEQLAKKLFVMKQRQPKGFFKNKLQEQILDIEKEILAELNKKEILVKL